MKKLQKEQDQLLLRENDTILSNNDPNSTLGLPESSNALSAGNLSLSQDNIKKKYKFGDGTRKLMQKIKEK